VGCLPETVKRISNLYSHSEIKTYHLPVRANKKGYMVCFRASCILDAMVHGKPVAWMDTDTIVRRNLFPMWENINPDSFKIVYREKNPDKSKFQAGVFVIGVSNSTIRFIEDWNQHIVSINEWYADQLWLYRIWKKHPGVKMIKMPLSLNNVGDSTKEHPFLKDSVVWHCKGAHFNHPVFQEEYQKYKGMK